MLYPLFFRCAPKKGHLILNLPWLFWGPTLKSLLYMVRNSFSCIIVNLHCRSSIFAKQIFSHPAHLVHSGDSCSGWLRQLRQENFYELAGCFCFWYCQNIVVHHHHHHHGSVGWSNHHKPENYFKAGEWTWLSCRDHLQGRVELSVCERDFGSSIRTVGGKQEKEIGI